MASVKQFLWVPGPLPGLNEVIEAAATVYGRGKRRVSKYSQMKKSWGERIRLHALSQGFKPIESATFSYLCIERERRRDPSNITAGALKLIEDGLQEAGLLAGDGWKSVLGIQVHWLQGKTPGVVLGCQSCTESPVLPPPHFSELLAHAPGGPITNQPPDHPKPSTSLASPPITALPPIG